MKVLGRNGQMLDVIDHRAAFTLEQAAVDREVLAARGMVDEVRGAGDRAARAEGFIEERRLRECLLGWKACLGTDTERSGDCVDGDQVGALLRDRLGRIEQLGKLLEVRHVSVHG